MGWTAIRGRLWDLIRSTRRLSDSHAKTKADCRFTFFSPLLAALPDLLLGVALANDGIFLAVHACLVSARCNHRGQSWGCSHRGLASSHFFFRFRHVRHPVLERPLAILFAAI